ncbi:MAG: hypothetical protein ACXQS8_08150 [Candidatus Helarchaeales archaeon]
MKLFELLEEKPSPRLTKILLLIGIVLMVITYSVLNFFITISGFDSNSLVYSELCFSGPILKSMYVVLVVQGTVDLYRIGQLWDYGFMVAYGLIIFSLALIIGRAFEEDSFWRKSGCVISLFGIVAPLLDVFENIFILLTLTNPLGFPDWLAVAQSAVSLPKWILIFVALIWALIASIILLIKKLKK